ncbi:MAG: hypothetical protein K2Z81_25535 [Cyanobacteria bacterium]|nr:hypothetical protein [Cyanobacteriota bacterium]
MTTASFFGWLLMGLLVGFAPGCSNSRPSMGLFIGLLMSGILASVLFMFGANPILASVMVIGGTLGGFIASLLPASNPIKRYFDLSRD